MLYDYKCSKCDFTDEYSTSPSLPADMNPPAKCPKCKKGKMEKLFSIECRGKAGIDCINGYEYEYGSKAWKKNMSDTDKAQVLLGQKDPY